MWQGLLCGFWTLIGDFSMHSQISKWVNEEYTWLEHRQTLKSWLWKRLELNNWFPTIEFCFVSVPMSCLKLKDKIEIKKLKIDIVNWKFRFDIWNLKFTFEIYRLIKLSTFVLKIEIENRSGKSQQDIAVIGWKLIYILNLDSEIQFVCSKKYSLFKIILLLALLCTVHYLHQ